MEESRPPQLRLPDDECPASGLIARKRGTCRDGVDRSIADLAERQHGVVRRAQLLELGIKPNAIEGRLKGGQLQAIHRGVYAVGHPALGLEGRLFAAVFACGPGAVLSHRSAARLWRLLPGSRGPIELTRGRGRRAPSGVWVHRSPLPGDEITAIDCIPVTSVSRTLLDLAVVVTRRRLEQAINEVDVLGLADSLSLHDLLERYPRRRGSGVLRDLLREESRFAGIMGSELEERFLTLLDDHRLPRPRLNCSVPIGRRFLEVDCLWKKERLIVELDGRAAHGIALAFEKDRERDRLLVIAGWQVIRLTWRQIHDDEHRVISDLRVALEATASTRRRPPRRHAA